MALTSDCDLFGSIHEEGINRIVRHLMRQRPSLFNYGTEYIRTHPHLMCSKVEVTKDVIKRGNPIITVEEPLNVLGTNGAYALDFCFQLTSLQIDFHPGNVFSLPPELELPEQHFAIKVSVCGGIGCPERFPNQPARDDKQPTDERPEVPTTVLHPEKLNCFCIDLFVVGHFEIIGMPDKQFLTLKMNGLELVDIKPDGLENSLECYLGSLVRLVLLPRMSFPLKNLVFDILDLATVTLSATPISAAVPNNPAVEKDQLKVYVNAVTT